MLRVLNATDEPNYTAGMVSAYRALGCEVVHGADDFLSGTGCFDLVHFHWPEEYVGWRAAPTAREIDCIEEKLRWWAGRAKLVFTVHNLYPHHGLRLPSAHRLYSLFYQYCNLITHFSNKSVDFVLKEFPIAQQAHHVVHLPAGYEATALLQTCRGDQRRTFGFGDHDFVILVIGRLRSFREMRLVSKAFSRARIPNKRLLMAGDVELLKPGWLTFLINFWWRAWLSSSSAAVKPSHIPEDRISRVVDSCDVIMLPRIGGLNSAVIFLGMTFGRMIIAPDCGAYPEHLANTRNIVYRTGDAAALAAALERASRLDTYEIGKENATIATAWSWRQFCLACVAELDETKALLAESGFDTVELGQEFSLNGQNARNHFFRRGGRDG